MQKETKAYYLEAINRAIEFIETDPSEKINLDEIAEYAFLSKYHFHRIFKSIIGNTTKEYLTRLRLEKSAQLLKNSAKSVNEIAYECGYTSPETFTRAFKSFFSTTPTLFRESAQQEIENKQKIYAEVNFNSLNLTPPKIVERADINLAYIRHFGSYNKVAKSYQQLMLWATKNLVLKLKPTTLGIVHDDPSLTDEPKIRFDACILVAKEIQPKGEVGYKKIRGGKFAVFRYKGPYEHFHTIYDYIYNVCLFDYKWSLRDEPALEWYIKSPPFYKSENFVTDFYLPIV